MQELKNSFKKSNGLKQELYVAKKLNCKGFEIVGHRVKGPFAELDLILYKNNQFHIVEVKSEGFDSQFFPRVSQKQKQRMALELEALVVQFDPIVLRAHLALVYKDGKVQFFSDFLSDAI